MHQYAIDISIQAIEKFETGNDVTKFIKQEFNKKYGETWQCFRT